MITSSFMFSDEINVKVDNLKCFLKIKGLPNEIYQSEPEDRPLDVKGIIP